MKKLIFQFLIASILLISGRDGMAEYVPGEVLVKFRGSSDSYAIKNLHSGIGSVKKMEFGRIGLQHIKLPVGMSVEKAVEYYKGDPNVEYAEPNYIVHAMLTPNDPSFGSLWGLNNTGQLNGTIDADIDAPEAWDHTTGSADVVIAVIDTGVAYRHPDLANNSDNNIWINTAESGPNCTDGIDNNANGIIDDCDECGDDSDNDGNGYKDDCRGWDFLDNDNDPSDYNEHGTHVAGTIAAVGDNSTGISGVMWQARIMPLRFLGISGYGSISGAIEAIEYAKRNGAQIINNSWGGDGYSQALKDAIDAFPGIVVCAAGNSGSTNDGSLPAYPASYTSSNIISVAATDHNDSLASFSNYGATSVDLAAPGAAVTAANTGIYSSIPQFTYGTPETLYSENFDSQAGPLPTSGDLSGWRRGGTKSTWEITSGTGVVGNSLEDSPGGNYLDNTSSLAGYLTPVDSVKDNRFRLTFDWKGELENKIDKLYILYSSNGSSWSSVDYRTGSTGGIFVQYTSDITLAADSLAQFYFGFGLISDSSVNYTGAYIDNVTLTREPISISGYTYASYQGTSMAAPHVSGVAGLIKALSPGLTNHQIKDAILKGIDAKSSLNGKVLTGGRLNANKALEYALSPYAPTGLITETVSSSQINLSWADNSANEEGFRVERKSGPGGSFSEIESIGPDITSYSSTGLSPGTAYYYRIRVYGAALGDNVYSDEAGSTTQSAAVSGSGGSGGGGGGGCFIATAAYGSMMHPFVKALREFRDRHLLTNRPGKVLVELYYKYSPPLADVIRDDEYLRFITRIILAPAVMLIVYPYYFTGLLLALTLCGAVMKKRRSAAVQNK